jgi:predicted nucleic acid-binding protein
MDFLDTNILVYCHDPKDPIKRHRAETLLTGLMDRGRLALSTQVLLEFYSVVTSKKLRTAAQAEALCRLLAGFEVVPATADLVFRAFALQQRHQISVWDAMIVQAALDAGCDTLYTEDMQHGLRVGQLEIVNPFLQPAAVHEPPAPYQRGRRAASSRVVRGVKKRAG